jgi:hypothetical protein
MSHISLVGCFLFFCSLSLYQPSTINLSTPAGKDSYQGDAIVYTEIGLHVIMGLAVPGIGDSGPIHLQQG